MKALYPTYPDANNYRGKVDREANLSSKQFDELRKVVFQRDGYTCQYCGFSAKEHQTINHIDCNPANNKKENLATACPMCNLILNTAIGCKVEGIVELYESSRFSQQKIMQITRTMRRDGKTDTEIIRYLGLKGKVPFKTDRVYLKRLFGFVTSWKGSWGGTEEALEFCYRH